MFWQSEMMRQKYTRRGGGGNAFLRGCWNKCPSSLSCRFPFPEKNSKWRCRPSDLFSNYNKNKDDIYKLKPVISWCSSLNGCIKVNINTLVDRPSCTVSGEPAQSSLHAVFPHTLRESIYYYFTDTVFLLSCCTAAVLR